MFLDKQSAALGLWILGGAGLLGSPAVRAADLAPGLNTSADFVQDYFRDLSGGLSRGSGAPSALHLSATLDSRYWGASGADRLYLDLLGTGGTSISNRAGDLQGLDNVEATNTARVFAAWYEHSFAGSGTSVRLGVQDYNALFDTLDNAALFINSSPGLDPSISQIGISTFPEPALGAVAQWQGRKGLYALAGVYDGTPGLPGHPYGTHLEWRGGDGAFSALEGGVSGGGDNPYKLGMGLWHDSRHFTDPRGRTRDTNQGGYLIGERTIPAGTDGLPWKTGVYFQLGLASPSRNVIDHYLGGGLTLTGILASRPDDQLGLALARAHTSTSYRNTTADASTAETVFELSYQAVLGTHFSLQPDLQYILDPGASNAVKNAWLLGARAELSW